MRLLLFAVFLLAACQPAQPRQTPFAVTVAPPGAAGSVAQAAQVSTAVPTAHLAPSRTPTLPPTATFTPTLTPTATLTPTITPTPTQTPIPTDTNTPVPIASPTPTDPADDPNRTPEPTWTPPPPDASAAISDHYRLRRPIAEGGTNWIDRTYPYGGTSGGRLQIHSGVEFVNPRGTPILAAADGTVVFAGSDAQTVLGPTPDYYGNAVVIEHSFTSPEGQPVYTLYGHMDQIEVEAGQTVRQGDPIGKVGDTGIAIGPHLHFEVRVGDFRSFSATRNPELWIYPYGGFGTLTGRVTDASGSPLFDVTLNIKSTDIQRYAFSYAGQPANSDPAFGENFTLGDLPANYYEVTVSENGRVRFQRIVYVQPNRSTWLDVQLN
jgi:murein DD-endopeptidase MepM/ murein hydrolase activator NlpD